MKCSNSVSGNDKTRTINTTGVVTFLWDNEESSDCSGNTIIQWVAPQNPNPHHSKILTVGQSF